MKHGGCPILGVKSLGKMVESELQSKLEDSVTLSWQELRASDLSGRARAFQSWWAAAWKLSGRRAWPD